MEGRESPPLSGTGSTTKWPRRARQSPAKRGVGSWSGGSWGEYVRWDAVGVAVNTWCKGGAPPVHSRGSVRLACCISNRIMPGARRAYFMASSLSSVVDIKASYGHACRLTRAMDWWQTGHGIGQRQNPDAQGSRSSDAPRGHHASRRAAGAKMSLGGRHLGRDRPYPRG